MEQSISTVLHCVPATGIFGGSSVYSEILSTNAGPVSYSVFPLESVFERKKVLQLIYLCLFFNG